MAEASLDELEVLLVEDEVELLEEADELTPGLPRPAVLTTVTRRSVVLPPVMVTLRPPRLPRRRGTMSEEYFSAAVTPVTRKVLSTLPFVTLAVRTVGAPPFFRGSLSAE